MWNKLKATLSLMILGFGALAQRPEVEMADTLRSNGKIYVVVTVLAIVFVAIIIYLISIDRKLSRLEKENKQ